MALTEQERIHRAYKQVSMEDRTCEGCGKPIIRNLAIIDGRLYHYGCMKQTKAKPTHFCLECFSYLTAKGIVKTDFDGETQRSCGNCGNPNLRRLRRWRKEA